MKKIWSLLLPSVMVLTLMAGCQSKQESPDASGGAAGGGEEQVELNFYAYGFQALVNLPGYEEQTKEPGDVYRLIIDAFTEEHPNVTINLVTLNPAGGGTEQLDLDLASGEKINLYYDSILRLTKYNGYGYYLDLSGYVPADTAGDFVSGALDTERMWYLPTDSTAMTMCINKDIFARIGAEDLLPDPETREWTTEEFLAALQAVKDANLEDVYPCVLWAANQSGDACNMSYLWGFGARFFDGSDYSRVALDSEEGYAGMEFLSKLYSDGLAVPGAGALNDDDMLAMWPKGQIAITGGYPYLETLGNTAEEPFETYFVNYPSANGANPPISPDYHAVAVFESENEAENRAAAEFAAYLTNSDWTVLLAQGAGCFTLRGSMEGRLELSSEAAALQELINRNGLINYGPTCPKWPELRPVFASELQAMFNGSKTARQAVDDFAAAANRILADNS